MRRPPHTSWPRGAPSLAIALAILSSSTPSAAQSQDEAGARALFNEGRALEKAGRYEEACQKLEAARRLYASPGVLLNLADCHEHLNRTASAWTEFGDATVAASNAGRPKEEAEAKRRQAELEGRLSRLSLRVSGPTSDEVIRRDGAVIDRVAWDSAIPVDPGTHVIEATGSGRSPWSTSVEVGDPGKTVVVEVPELDPLTKSAVRRPSVAGEASGSAGASRARGTPTSDAAAGEPQSATSDGNPSHGLGTQRAFALVGIGLGLAGIGVGTVLGLQAISKNSQASKVCPQDQSLCTNPEGPGLWQDAVNTGNLATLAFIVGGVAVVGGALLWWTGGERAPAEPRVQLSLGYGSVRLKGTW